MSLAFYVAPAAITPASMRDSMSAACRRQVKLMLLILALAAPAFAGGASALRLAFPVAVAGIALWLLVRHPFGRFLSFVLWLFVLTPFVRRIVDFQAGWQEVNVLMVAPYAAASLCLGSLVALIVPGRLQPGAPGGNRPGPSAGLRGGGLFLAVVLAVTYGLILALLHDHIANGMFDALRWAVPPALGVAIVLNRADHPALRTEVEAFMLVATPAAALYGLYQFVQIPPWDANWMNNVDMNTIGSPLPYQVRIFGTLNSPGPYAFFLSIGIVLLLCSRHRLRWLGITTGTLALLLSFVRTSWLGLALCLAFMALTAPRAVRASMLGLIGAAILIPPLLMLDPDIGETITGRFESFGSLGKDESASARLFQYRTFVDALDRDPLGQGLALHGATASQVSVRSYEVIDGGFIEILASLGLVGGLVYLFSVTGLVLIPQIQPNGRTGDMLDIGYRAFSVAGLFTLLSGTCTVGEGGIFFWLAVAMPIAALPSPATAPRTSAPGAAPGAAPTT
ncbi:O-antigen ligase family protein [Faunimonas pinastri]|nr:O-antigen ligase family protein [Faunimonas pinastri]